MTMPLISVVIPAYKAEKTVGKTLESVRSQTYPHWEALVINDCSPDNTQALLEQAAAEDERIRVLVNEKNSGVSYSRNRGITQARGEWIAFLDSDDYWTPDKLEKQVAAAQSTGADIVYTGYAYVNGAGEPLPGVFAVPVTTSYSKMLKKNVMSTSGVMLRKKWMMKYPFRSDVAHEDLFQWLTLLKMGAVAVGIDEQLHTIRISQRESRSGNKLRAATNRMRLYRQMGMSWPSSVWNWGCYVINALNKYLAIHSK